MDSNDIQVDAHDIINRLLSENAALLQRVVIAESSRDQAYRQLAEAVNAKPTPEAKGVE